MNKLGIVCALTSMLAAAPALADEPRDAARAETHALEAGRAQEPHATLARAFRHERSVTLEAALGRAELRLGMPRDAAEHLTNALRAVKDTDPAWVDIAMDLASARSAVATLRVTTSEPGATIYVDGELVGESPLDRELFVDEGTHEIRAVGASGAAARRVHGSMGKRVDVALVLVPADPSEPQALARERLAFAPAPEPPRARRALLFGGAALSATALAIGGAFAIAAATDRGDTTDQKGYATGFLLGGGVVLAATLKYALWPAEPPAPKPRATIAVAPGPLGASAAYRW